ncbi:MAG TPA: glycosyltransferase family 9 protein [Vicinamibacterales bacterium]|nr:glycosyltransferase family 9 protein [Vicinamibacterales bacterium]
MNRVLLVRLREIGDVVFTTPAIRALRRRFPAAHLAYLVEPRAAPIVLRNPHLDEVIVAPRVRGARGLAADLALGRSLRNRAFDLAIDFHGGPRASLLTWLSHARDRVGYEVVGRSWMYTTRVARPRTLRPRHSVENQWDLLRALGIPPPDRDRDGVEMPVDPVSADDVGRRLASAGVTGAHQLAVVHVSAGNPFRRWPLEHFIAVVTALASETRQRVVVTSGPSEQEAAGRVVAGARAALGVEAGARILSCGEFSLPELRALLDRAALFIGGDSGPLHIAATTAVGIVGLYGPTLPERSAPWRRASHPTISVDAGPLPCRPCDQRACVPGDFRCLSWIPPERVVEPALRWMGGAPRPA